MMPRWQSGHVPRCGQNQPGGPSVSRTLWLDQHPPLPHLKKTSTASSKCSTSPSRDGPVLPHHSTETGILFPGTSKVMDIFMFYMRKLHKNNPILQSQESLGVWRYNPPLFSQEWFLPHFGRVPVNLNMLRSDSWGSKWTEEKMVDSLWRNTGDMWETEKYFSHQHVRIAKMSTLCFIDICVSSSETSLLFHYFKNSLCFRTIFPSKCKQMPGKI